MALIIVIVAGRTDQQRVQGEGSDLDSQAVTARLRQISPGKWLPGKWLPGWIRSPEGPRL